MVQAGNVQKKEPWYQFGHFWHCCSIKLGTRRFQSFLTKPCFCARACLPGTFPLLVVEHEARCGA